MEILLSGIYQIQVVEVEEDFIGQGLEKSIRKEMVQKGSKSSGKIDTYWKMTKQRENI